MKSDFKNKTFYYILVSFILAFILWNIYAGIYGKNIYALLPIAIESALLILVLTHHHYARLAILIWTIVFIIGAPALSVFGNILGSFDDGFKSLETYSFIYNLVSIVIGILIVDYTIRTVKVERETAVVSTKNIYEDLG